MASCARSSSATRSPRASARRWGARTTSTGTTPAPSAASAPRAAAAELLQLNAGAIRPCARDRHHLRRGLQQAFRMDSMSKPLHAGRAAEAGVTAALAAREGVTGSLDVIEGERASAARWATARTGRRRSPTLGRDFHITRMTFKNHACCGHTFAAIDGALELKKRMGCQAGRYRAAAKSAPIGPALEVAHYEEPRTPAEGRFSLKYVVATALTHGSVRLAAFENDAAAGSVDARADGENRSRARSGARRHVSRASARRAWRSAARRPARGVLAAHAQRRSRTRRSPTRS